MHIILVIQLLCYLISYLMMSKVSGLKQKPFYNTKCFIF